MRRVVGYCIIGLGVWIALFPFVDTYRFGGEAIAALSNDIGTATVDQRQPVAAMFDDDFVLATRVYQGASERDVVVALNDAGFVAMGDQWWALTVDSSFDAVRVRTSELPGRRVLVEVSAVDPDHQSVWPFIALFGMIIVAIGLSLAASESNEPVAATVPGPRTDLAAPA